MAFQTKTIAGKRGSIAVNANPSGNFVDKLSMVCVEVRQEIHSQIMHLVIDLEEHLCYKVKAVRLNG